MGVSSSILADLMLKPFIVKCDHETGCQCSALNVDRQLETIRNEVKQQERLITENVIQEITSKEDTMVLRYSDLKDMTTISKHIEKIFEDEPEAIEFLTNAASKMIAVFHSSSEMKELLRLNQVKKVCLQYMIQTRKLHVILDGYPMKQKEYFKDLEVYVDNCLTRVYPKLKLLHRISLFFTSAKLKFQS
jgi:hypothetical protein